MDEKKKKRTILIRAAITASLPAQTGNPLFEEWCKKELEQGSTIRVEDTETGEKFQLVLEGGVVKRSAK